MSLTLRSLKSTSITYCTQQIDQYSTSFELLKSTSPHPHACCTIHESKRCAPRMARSTVTSGPASARNVRARVSSEVGWSTTRPACSMPTVPLDPLHACTAGFVGGGGCGLRVGCLPRQGQQVRPACPEIRPWVGAAPKPHPGRPQPAIHPPVCRRPNGDHESIDLGCRNTRSDGPGPA